MSSPPRGWVGFGALKNVEKGKRQRDQEVTQTSPSQTEVQPTQATETQVPQTQVNKTEVQPTQVRETQVPENLDPAARREPTQSSRTQVPLTEVPQTSEVRDPGQPGSLSGALPQTQVPKTQAPRTRARRTQVPESQVAPISEVRKEGYTRFDNWVLDDFLPRLDPYEQIVFLRLYRLTVGFNRTTCLVSHEKLAEKTNLSLSTVKRVCNRLVALGHIASSPVLGGSRSERGCEFEILGPVAASTTQASRTQVPQTQARQSQVRETQVPQTHMKEHEIKHDEKPVYEIRRAAARLKEAHRNDASYTHERLVAEVKAGFVMQGREISNSEIEEALKGLAM